MVRGFNLFLIVVLFFSCIESSLSQKNENLQLSLITVDAGGEIYSLFGHTALRLKNPDEGLDVVFNYGIFDFKTPNFTIKFMRGKLPYSLGVYSYSDFLSEYQQEKRSVKEQIVNIDDNAKIEIIEFLKNNALPENREYKYDFFFDNCSSRIRDIFINTLDINKDELKADSKMTFRQQLHENLIGHVWTRMGIDMIIGARADKESLPFDQMFLPLKLHDILGSTNVKGKPFLEKSIDVLSFQEEQEARKIPTVFQPKYTNILLLSIIILFYFMDKQNVVFWISRMWYILAFIASLIIIFLWFFTDHLATKTNWNILWLNPLYLFMFYKNNLNRRLVTLSLIGFGVICLANEFLHFLPQDMPIDYMWFFFAILLIDLFKKNNQQKLTEIVEIKK
jgi:hypothetical protein